MCSNADPRAALAEYIRHKTDNGNKVVDYLHDVLEDRLDGVKHLHRECAAAILTEYGDLAAIRFQEKNKEEKKAKPSPRPRKREEREDSEFDAALARVIRDKTNDTQDVADYLIDTMNGIDSAIESGLGKIRHQQRVSAAAELLRRAFDRDPDYTRTTQAEVRVPTQADADSSVPLDTEPTEQATEDTDVASGNAYTPEEEARIQEVLDRIKKIAEEADPSEYEEEESSDRRIDYSMWDIIDSQPQPVITEEHARIGAALFREAMQKQRLWEESNIKIPTRKDHDNYDDG